MAIQMRRGQLANYDKSKMLPGEWGISIDNDSDNQKAFISFAPGVSKEVMMVEDAEEQIAVATAEAIDMATQEAEAWAHGNSFHVNDYASGDGSTKSFTLAETPSSIIGVYVDGSSVSAYTLSGKTITFTTAPASGSNNIRVYYTVNTTTDNAKYYKEQAEEVAESIPEDYSELSDDVDQLKNAIGDYYISFFQRHNGIMNGAGTSWMNINDSYQHIVIPVTAGQYYNIIHTNVNSSMAFLTAYTGTETPPQLSSTAGYTSRIDSSTTGRTGIIPSDVNYLWLMVILNDIENLPVKLEIGGWDYMKTVMDKDKSIIESVADVLPTIADLSRNIFDKYSCTDGYYVAPETGNRTPSENYFITDYMPIEYGKYLLFSRNGVAQNARWFALYDANKTVIPYVNDVHANMSSYFIADKNAKFCRATFAISLNKSNIQVELSDTNSPTALVPYGWRLQDDKTPVSSIFGKKVTWYGDSIAQTNWWNDVNAYFGFNSTNCGVGGTTITNSSSNPAAMCEKTRMQGEYPAQTDPNTGTVTQPVAIPNDTEIIFICGGTNDWLNNMETGGDDFRKYPGVNSSGEYKLFRFYSACHYMFKNMMELFPNAKIIVCGTPFGQYPNRFSPTYSNGILNNAGMTSIDYEDALCDIAGLWGIPCIHYGRNMQINAENVAALLDPSADSHLHPTTNAAKTIFSDTVIRWLKSNYC